MSRIEGGSSKRSKIIHEIESSVKMPRNIEDIVVDAADIVWRGHNPHTPTVIKHKFVKVLPAPDEKNMACYVLGDNLAIYARDVIKKEFERGKNDVTEEELYAIVSGHEGTHLVQDNRSPNYFASLGKKKIKYENNPYEIEATREGLHVAKRLFPDLEGTFYDYRRSFRIPKKSKYT